MYASPAELQQLDLTSPHDIVSLRAMRLPSDRSEGCYCEHADVIARTLPRRKRLDSEGGVSQCSKLRYAHPVYVTYDRRHPRVMSTCLHPSRVRTDSTCDSVFESDYATRAQIAAVHTPQPACVTSLGCSTACVTSSVMTTPRSTLSRKTVDYAQYMESGSSERSESMRYFALESNDTDTSNESQ